MKSIFTTTFLVATVITTSTAQMFGSGGSSAARGASINSRIGGFDSLYSGLSSSLSPYRSFRGPANHPYPFVEQPNQYNSASSSYGRWVPVNQPPPSNPAPAPAFHSRWSPEAIRPGSHAPTGALNYRRTFGKEDESDDDVIYDDEEDYSQDHGNIIDEFLSLVAEQEKEHYVKETQPTTVLDDHKPILMICPFPQPSE